MTSRSGGSFTILTRSWTRWWRAGSRSPIRGCSPDTAGRRAGNGMFPATNCSATVSYTHLDVYKRQSLWRSCIPSSSTFCATRQMTFTTDGFPFMCAVCSMSLRTSVKMCIRDRPYAGLPAQPGGHRPFPDLWPPAFHVRPLSLIHIFSTYTSYLYIGHIYEKARNYRKAYESYLLAKDALELNREEYVNELSKDLLWVKLHIDSFCYSAELEDYYSCYLATDEFSRAFVNSEFRLAVANIIISLHHGRTDEAKRSLAIAKEICEPHYRGKLHSILAKHKYYESLNATPESITFVKSIQI